MPAALPISPALAHANVSSELPDDRYTVWGRNLTNVAYAININQQPASDGVGLAAGRTFGMTIRANSLSGDSPMSISTAIPAGIRRLCRSALYVPAINARAIEKAAALPCDAIIIDLEDAVAPVDKVRARALAVEAAGRDFGERPVAIRVNGLDTEWGMDDLAAATATRPYAIVIPKLDDPALLARARAVVDPSVALWAMIETCRSILALGEIISAAPDYGLTVLVAGTNDLAKEMRLRGDDEDRAALVPSLLGIVTAGRAANLAILDGVYNRIDDEPGLARECEQGASFGFDGKTLIHPSQIAAANRAFSPTPDELRRAEAVVAAFQHEDNRGKGVLRIDGEMVELLHLEQAHRLLAHARRAAPRRGRGRRDRA